jgi:hypothetical protein
MPELLVGRGPDPTFNDASDVGGAVRWLLAAFVACLGLLALLIGGVYVVVDRTQRDAGGYLMNPATDVATDTAAIVARSLQANGDTGLRYDISGDVQLKLDGANELFIGVASARSVERYLAGVAVKRISDLGDATGTTLSGSTTPAPPATQRIWVASATGSRDETLRWQSTRGDWRVVVMNADGSRGVRAAISAGARHPSSVYFGVGVGLLAAGAALLAAGVAIVPGRRGAP